MIKLNKTNTAINIVFPLNINLGYDLDQRLFLFLKKILKGISLQNITNQTGSQQSNFSNSLKAFSQFLAAFQKNSNDLRELIDFLDKIWLSDTLDHGAEMGLWKIMDYKKKIMFDFERTFERQKEATLQLLHNAFNTEYNTFVEIIRSISSNYKGKAKLKTASQILERLLAAYYVPPKNKSYYVYIFCQFMNYKPN